jgi:hypothetical protein
MRRRQMFGPGHAKPCVLASTKPALAKPAMYRAPPRRRLTPGVVLHSRSPHITGPPSPNGRANERSPARSAAVLHPECEPAFSP